MELTGRCRPGELGRVCDSVLRLQAERPAARGTEVLVERTGRPLADHIERTRYRVGGHRQPASHGFDQHQPEGIGTAREHEDTRLPVDLGELGVRLHAKEGRVGVALPQRLDRRPAASDPLLAWQFEVEEGLDVLLHRHPPGVQEHRGILLAARRSGLRTEHTMVDPSRPTHHIGKAPRLEVADDRRGGCHDCRRGRVKAPQQLVHPRRRDRRARRDIFGEARVICGGKAPAAIERDTTRRPAEWTLGADVQGIGPEGVDQARHRALGAQGEADVRVGRAGQRAEILRGEEPHRMPEPLEFGGGVLQGLHHTVDLRKPGVGDNQDAVQVGPFRKWRAVGRPPAGAARPVLRGAPARQGHDAASARCAVRPQASRPAR